MTIRLSSFVPSRALPFCGVAALLMTTACSTQPVGERPLESTKYTLENTDKFTLLSEPIAPAIACTGLQQRTLPDGRFEVIANLKNRENRRIEIQASCVFKDSVDAVSGIETPWQNIALAADATETAHFVAPSGAPHRYTVRVRSNQ